MMALPSASATVRALLAGIAVLALSACALRPPPGSSAESAPSPPPGRGYAAEEEMLRQEGTAADGSGRGAAPDLLARKVAPPAEPPPAPLPAPGARLAGERMVARDGSLTLRAPEPESVLDAAVERIRVLGGYLESRRRGWAMLRVPAASFDSAFADLMRLGEVIHFSQQAADITEAYQDTDLRQRVVNEAIARLETLIQRAQSDAQRLRLLNELRRYREEWETLEARRRTLQQRAAYAAIALEVRGRSDAASAGPRADFPQFAWIHRLDPFRARPEHGRRLRFQGPDHFAVTTDWRVWRATSAEGTEMSARTLRTGLKGDARFWQQALVERLRPQFRSTEVLEAAGFRFARFTAHGPRAYEYWVGVQADGESDRVRVVELYFPDAQQRERHAPALLASLRKGARWW